MFVRHEAGGDEVRLFPGATIELACHLNAILDRGIDQEGEPVADHQRARAEHGSHRLGIGFAPVAIARKITDGDDIPALDAGIGSPLPASRRVARCGGLSHCLACT